MKKILTLLTFLLLTFILQSKTPKAYTPYMPDIDPQTGEFYDLWIDSRVKLVTRTDPGPMYMTNMTLQLGGPRLDNYTELHGFKQRSEQPYTDDSFEFDFQDTSWGRFEVKTLISDNNCIDLHSSSNPNKSNYISTLCYNNTYIQDNRKNITAYSPNANTFIKFDYNNHNDNVVHILSFQPKRIHNNTLRASKLSWSIS